jgi:hypothetical protein
MKEKYSLETRGGVGKRKKFTWWYDEERGILNIENEEGLFHRFHQDEIFQILNSVKSEFGKDYFPLANNVEALWKGAEKRGLGTVILDHSPKKVLHAQGASYFGPVFEQIGFFQWNEKNRGIQWRLVNRNITKKIVIERLKNPLVQKRADDKVKKTSINDSLLTVDELALKLKVPKSWIYARTRESGPEAMPKIHVGKYLRFRWDDVWNWIQKNQ